MAAHYFLSPHLDDAALSCGGRIHQQTARGEPVAIVTLFAGDAPTSGLSPFAQSLHERWQLRDNASALRRAEDEQAASRLGAEGIHLHCPDAIYRTSAEGFPLYDSEEAIFGPVHPGENMLIANIARVLRELISTDAAVVAPLTAGHHVDHLLTRAAAEQSPRPILYYEDYPYAEKDGAIEAALGAGNWLVETVEIDEADLRAKSDAVSCYRSQISSFWPDDETMRAAMREFALRCGGGIKLVERYWRKA